jgi:hypothetical protein
MKWSMILFEKIVCIYERIYERKLRGDIYEIEYDTHSIFYWATELAIQPEL